MGFTLGTKFNDNTDWEFTVSQELISEVVSGGGVTEADIAPYCYVALIDARVAAMLQESSRNTNDGLYPWALDYCPAYNLNNGSHPAAVKMNVTTLAQYPVTCYQRNILTYYGTIGGKSGHFLVMDVKNIKKWIMDFDTYPAYTAGSVSTTATFPGYSGTAYIYSDSNVPRVSAYQPVGTPTENIFLMNVFNDGDNLWIGSLNPTAHSKEKTANEHLTHQAWDFAYAAADTYNANYTGFILQGASPSLQGWAKFPDAEFPAPSGVTTGFASYLECDDTVHSIIKVFGQYGNNSNPYITDCEQGNIVKTLKDVHTVESWGGLLFKDNNIVYKPIIEGGVVTGFTSDMDIPSEWDQMTNVTGNNISPVPPSPASTGDKVDDMTLDPLFGLSSDAGFAAYYLMTSGDIASLHTWLTSTTFPDGYDPYQYIISLIQFPLILSPTWCTAGTSVSVHIGGEDTGITASLIGTEQTWRGLGTFNVPRENGNFLDYEPYSQYEVYIPCCGWVTVPDIVAGHQISVRINYDLTDATIIGNVYVNIEGDWLLIASKSGMMGRQTVISGEAQGVKNAQITSALLSAGTGALNVATGIMSENAVAAVSGGYNVVAGLAQANIASNSSYVRSIGSTGGRSLLCQYDKCYCKITTTKTDIPANYGHNVGYVCNKKGKVSDFSGFTVFQNVDTSNIAGATERERQMIKRILESGVIINPPSD